MKVLFLEIVNSKLNHNGSFKFTFLQFTLKLSILISLQSTIDYRRRKMDKNKTVSLLIFASTSQVAEFN